MRRMLFKSLIHGPLTEAAPAPDESALAESQPRSTVLRVGTSAERFSFAKSTPDPVTAVSWKSMRSVTCFTTSSVSACALSRRLVTLMCFP